MSGAATCVPPAERDYLRTPAAIRERGRQVLAFVEEGRSAWFALNPDGLDNAVQATLAATRARYPDPAAVPFHARWRHFEAGGRDRWAALASRLAHLPAAEVARRRMDLAILSVLLDAGAGPDWRYREPRTGETYARYQRISNKINSSAVIITAARQFVLVFVVNGSAKRRYLHCAVE